MNPNEQKKKSDGDIIPKIQTKPNGDIVKQDNDTSIQPPNTTKTFIKMLLRKLLNK